MRLLLFTSSMVAGLVVLLACTPPCRCYSGVLPLDGSTAVDPEGPLYIVGAVDQELLALGAAVVLVGPDGEVPLDLERDELGLTAWPTNSLPNGDYEVRVHAGAHLQAQVHNHRTGDKPTTTFSRFTVGTSQPEVLALFEEADVLYLLFSEPVDRDSIDGRVWVDDARAVVSAIDDTLFRLDWLSNQALSEPRVDLADGITSPTGVPVPATRGLVPDRFWTLERSAGATWCDC